MSFLALLWQVNNPDGFNVIWQYFGWANQTLSVFTLWAITVYLTLHKKPYIITLLPAVFMTSVCTSFLVVSKNAFGLPVEAGYATGAVVAVASFVLFFCWKRKAAVK